MYIPAHFNQEHKQEIYSFLQQHPFGMMVDVQDDAPVASHIPFMIAEGESGEWVLTGHVALANPQWKRWDGSHESLAVFTGPHSYVSSSWYEKLNVSTWNYQAVHLYGTAKVMTEEAFQGFLASLTRKYEQAQQSPLYLESMPEEYVQKTKRGAVGFEMKVTRVDAKWKLSQNRSPRDRENVIQQLSSSPDPGARAIADEMKKQQG